VSDPLASYLHDHLAGSAFAIELLKTLRDQHSGDPLGAFAGTLLPDIEQDREVLQGIIFRVGQGHPTLKEAAAWLAEKVSELKLRHSFAGGLETFQALETLSLGILGKRSLWRALALVSQMDSRVAGVDYEQLTARAERQYSDVEEQRLNTARQVFEHVTA
jgi:hypothetical protein